MMNFLLQSNPRIIRPTWVIAVLLILISSSRSTSQNVADRAPAQQQGLQFAELAIALEAENESAWSYKTNLLLEMAKLSEMSGDKEQQSLFLPKYKKALKVTTKIAESARQKRKDPDPEQFFLTPQVPLTTPPPVPMIRRLVR